MQPGKIEKIVDSASEMLASLAAVVLALMMFLMATDVVCRYIFNSPVPGALELVEYMMAVVVPLAIAYCAAHRSHVSVEMVVERLASPVRKVINFIVTILSLAFIGLVSWQNFLNIGDAFASKMTSAVLHIPSYPFVVPAAIGMSLYALIMLIHLVIRK